MDKTDIIPIRQLLVLNHDNKQIPTMPKIPLSAVNNRARKLIGKRIVVWKPPITARATTRRVALNLFLISY